MLSSLVTVIIQFLNYKLLIQHLDQVDFTLHSVISIFFNVLLRTGRLMMVPHHLKKWLMAGYSF